MRASPLHRSTSTRPRPIARAVRAGVHVLVENRRLSAPSCASPGHGADRRASARLQPPLPSRPAKGPRPDRRRRWASCVLRAATATAGVRATRRRADPALSGGGELSTGRASDSPAGFSATSRPLKATRRPVLDMPVDDNASSPRTATGQTAWLHAAARSENPPRDYGCHAKTRHRRTGGGSVERLTFYRMRPRWAPRNDFCGKTARRRILARPRLRQGIRQTVSLRPAFAEGIRTEIVTDSPAERFRSFFGG